MERAYTSEVYDSLVSMIDEIADSDFCGFTDAFGDLWYWISSAIGILNVDNYLNDISSYHKKVLDQHDTTVEKLDRIFEAVGAEDQNGGASFASLTDQLNLFDQVLVEMQSALNPDGTLSLSEMQRNLANCKDKIQGASLLINDTCDKLLSEREKRLAKETLFDLLKGMLSVVGKVCSFIKHIATLDFPGAISDVWGVINEFFDVAGDVCAFLTLGIGQISRLFPNSRDFRMGILEKGEEAYGYEGLKDVLIDTGADGLADIVQVIDTAAAAYNIYDSIDTIFNSDIVNLLSNKNLTAETKLLGIPSLLMDKIHITFGGMKLPSTPLTVADKCTSVLNSVVSSAKTVIGWVDAIWGEGSIESSVFEGLDLFGYAKKTKEFYDEYEELVKGLFNQPVSASASFGGGSAGGGGSAW